MIANDSMFTNHCPLFSCACKALATSHWVNKRFCCTDAFSIDPTCKIAPFASTIASTSNGLGWLGIGVGFDSNNIHDDDNECTTFEQLEPKWLRIDSDSMIVIKR